MGTTPAAAVNATPRSGAIRVGIGGWTYEPWRTTFYPPKLAHSRELDHASRQVNAIEINGTFYRTQKPAIFAKWRDQTPDDFVFAVKAVRYATNRKVLADAGESVSAFLKSGLAELGTKLGPVLWQFAPGKKFDAVDFERFLDLLPPELAGLRLRHALEVRHPTFMCEQFVDLARDHGAAIVYTDSADYPSFADITSDLVYARLMRARATVKTGYASKALDEWAARASQWARGGAPDGLHRVVAIAPRKMHRDAFVFFINGAKERAPAAAVELLRRVA